MARRDNWPSTPLASQPAERGTTSAAAAAPRRRRDLPPPFVRTQAMQRVMQNPEFLSAAEQLGRGLMSQVWRRGAPPGGLAGLPCGPARRRRVCAVPEPPRCLFWLRRLPALLPLRRAGLDVVHPLRCHVRHSSSPSHEPRSLQ